MTKRRLSQTTLLVFLLPSCAQGPATTTPRPISPAEKAETLDSPSLSQEACPLGTEADGGLCEADSYRYCRDGKGFHGPFVALRHDAELLRGHFVDGKPSGAWQQHDANGRLVATQTLEHGAGTFRFWQADEHAWIEADFEGRHLTQLRFYDREKALSIEIRYRASSSTIEDAIASMPMCGSAQALIGDAKRQGASFKYPKAQQTSQ